MRIVHREGYFALEGSDAEKATAKGARWTYHSSRCEPSCNVEGPCSVGLPQRWWYTTDEALVVDLFAAAAGAGHQVDEGDPAVERLRATAAPRVALVAPPAPGAARAAAAPAHPPARDYRRAAAGDDSDD